MCFWTDPICNNKTIPLECGIKRNVVDHDIGKSKARANWVELV